MSDYDREPPLTFDARRSSGPAERPRSGGLLLISAVILVVLVIAFGIFAVSHMGGGESAEPTTIETMKAPAETPPAAQTPIPTGLPVETVQTLPPGGSPSFAPTPEQPGARPIAATPTPSPPPASVPAAKAPVAAQPVKGAAPAKPDPIGDKIAATKAAAKVAAIPAAPAVTATKTAGPQNGTSTVQIGAFGSQAIAEQQWNAVALALPADMVGKSRQIETVQVGADTRYRAIIGGFASRAQADAFCGKLKAQGKDCFARN